ncbi:MAG TPA: hypothetical protein VFT87_04555, partial [Candidatus Saccharimonadales bacterium]|nr:hypothetical protein [Candidatus Saccharimonadales bacterium]
EAAYHLIGIPDEESFYDNLSNEHGFSFYEIHVDGVIDVVLVPENWTTRAAEHFRDNPNRRAHLSLLPNGEEHYVLNNYQVFDPNTRTFVSPR